MDIEKAKKVFEKYINGKDTMKETLIKAIEVVLNELDKDNNIISDLQNEVTLKQCELDNKDKIIIAMAEQLTTPVHGIDWVIDYFTKKVTKED